MEKLRVEDVKIGALYGRVSVDDAVLVQHGSLEQQKNLGLELAEQLSRSSGVDHKVKYILIEERGVSGGSTNRPKYQELLDLIRSRKIQFLVAKEISRLSRSTRDFCDLMELCKKNGVAVHIRGMDMDPSQPNGEMVFKMIATIAEFERKLIVQRTKDSIRASALFNGKINGGSIPLGFKRNPIKKGFLLIDEQEMEKVKFLYRTFLETGSLKETLVEANRIGITNTNKKPFKFDSLRRLLTNPKYIGKMRVVHGANDELEDWVNLPSGSVISEDLFNQVQAKIKRLQESKNQNRRDLRTYLLTGLLFHEDGTPFVGYSGTRRDKQLAYYYRNRVHKISIPAEELESAVINSLKDAHQNSEELNEYLKQLETEKYSRLDLINKHLQAQKMELRKINEDDSNLLDQIRMTAKTSKAVNVVQWLEKRIGENEKRKIRLEGIVLELEREKVELEACQTDAKKFRTHVAMMFEALAKAEPVKQRAFIREVFERVEVKEGNQIRVIWKIPRSSSLCDTGGNSQVASKKWGA